MPLRISPSPDSFISTGDFGARVTSAGLLVPEWLNGVLRRHNVRTAEQFMSYLHSFPSLFAQELGWSLEDVSQAQKNLVCELRGSVLEEFLEPEEPPQFGYGALDPSRLNAEHGRSHAEQQKRSVGDRVALHELRHREP